MNVVAMVLYGELPRYTVGAVENARLLAKFYPGWKLHVWVDDSSPAGARTELARLGAVLHGIPAWCRNKMFARFLAHDLEGVESYVVRDVDSRFSEREHRAVEEWQRSNAQLHVMRDHPWHNQAIMGGLWGWRKKLGGLPVRPLVAAGAQAEGYGKDQEWLRKFFWEPSRSRLVHDSCGTFDGTRALFQS